MRRELSLAPVTDADTIALVQGVYDALPSAVLFLKKLDRLRLLRPPGLLIRSAFRARSRPSRNIRSTIWTIFGTHH